MAKGCSILSCKPGATFSITSPSDMDRGPRLRPTVFSRTRATGSTESGRTTTSRRVSVSRLSRRALSRAAVCAVSAGAAPPTATGHATAHARTGRSRHTRMTARNIHKPFIMRKVTASFAAGKGIGLLCQPSGLTFRFVHTRGSRRAKDSRETGCHTEQEGRRGIRQTVRKSVHPPWREQIRPLHHERKAQHHGRHDDTRKNAARCGGNRSAL